MASSELSGAESLAESHSDGPTFSLENILGNDHDKLEHPDTRPEGWDEEDAEREAAHGYCVECEGAWYRSSLYLAVSIYALEFYRPTSTSALRNMRG
jgi:hypothetical protein